MKEELIKGRISSEESLGLVDGPGIRYVVFLQGCQLRCKYCHNPETWDLKGKSYETTAEELIRKICRYKSYFGEDGGVTFSGGEPLLQPEFLLQCLKLCKQEKIHTVLDTAGVGFGDYDEILKNVDLVILDVKAIEEEEYQELTGKTMAHFNEFLLACQKNRKKIWLRQVIVPTINDDEVHAKKLNKFAKNIKNVEKIELLPYKTIGVQKYKQLNLPYRLKDVSEMDEEKCKKLEQIANGN